MIMTSERTTNKWPATGARATLPRKRFRFSFDLGSNIALGSNFECLAVNEQDALDDLERLIPGVNQHIKSIEVLH